MSHRPEEMDSFQKEMFKRTFREVALKDGVQVSVDWARKMLEQNAIRHDDDTNKVLLAAIQDLADEVPPKQ
jgi:hypothetical protein